MFLKDFIGKKVLSYEGKVLGYTRCAFFSSNFKRITAMLCADEEEEDFILPLSQTQNVDDALVMPRKTAAKVTGAPYSPLLKQAYSTQGKFLGMVSNAVICNLSVTALIVAGKEYPIERVKAFGDCILINTAEKVTKPKARRSSAALTKPEILLGRVLKFDIADKDGRLLFCKGTVITQNVLKKAALNKKLVELTAKTLTR